MEKKYLGKDVALQKLQRYCAYQERCHQEVRQKLLDLGVYGDTLEEVILDLISDNFLNEERFAQSYARGKFRTKNWGRVRIQQELKQRQLTAYCIKKGLQEIDEQEYLGVLKVLLQKKLEEYAPEGEFQAQAKAAQYALRRGFESDLIWQILKT
jgi:regulatory protein